MPLYEFRCKPCGAEFSLSYKSTRDYSSATPACPTCHSTQLSRLIRHISVQTGGHDYRRMSSSEMLSVLESGNQKQVQELYRQVGTGVNPSGAQAAHEQAKTTLPPDTPSPKRRKDSKPSA